MANTQAQFGFKHNGYLSGFAPDYQLAKATLSATYSTIIGFGDPVIHTTTGNNIILATPALATGGAIAGIFQGCTYIPSGGGAVTWSAFWPGAAAAGSVATAYILNSPGATFLVAANLTAISSANIGNVANFVAGTPSTTGGGFSAATLDQSTAATSTTVVSNLPFKIVQLYEGVGNGSDPTSNYNWAVVTFNFQVLKSLTGN